MIAAVSSFTTNNSNVLAVYGGGGKLFGGTYLILFYAGMLFMKHYYLLQNIVDRKGQALTVKRKKLWVIAGVSMLLAFAWWKFECIDRFSIDSKLPFGAGINPPSISSAIMALLMLSVCYAAFTLLEQYDWTKNISKAVAWLGGYSMYIFLYHLLYKNYFLNHIIFKNTQIKCLVYFGVMIGGSVWIGIVIDRIKDWCEKAAEYSNAQIAQSN